MAAFQYKSFTVVLEGLGGAVNDQNSLMRGVFGMLTHVDPCRPIKSN